MGQSGKGGRRSKVKPRRRRRKAAPASPYTPPWPLLRSSFAKWLGAAVALMGFVAVSWLMVVYPSARGPGDGRAVQVTVPAHTTAGELASRLGGAGVLAHPRAFAFWVRFTGGTRRVVPGAHLVTDDATPRELLARLERGGAAQTARVTFPEGWTRFEIARRLEDKHVATLRDVLNATTDPALLHELGIEADSAEGFLFPATYDLQLDSDARDVVRRMKREFDRRWDLLSRARAASLADVMSSAKLDVLGVVTLASMVEKEAAVDDERPLIASVFLNRLRDPTFRPRHLECDPTASYGCLVFPERAASCANFNGKATAAIEHDADNPYSTYVHEGLPPGPIANPGYKALDAVAAPAVTRYLYFVARGEARHTFSESYEAHLAAVRSR